MVGRRSKPVWAGAQAKPLDVHRSWRVGCILASLLYGPFACVHTPPEEGLERAAPVHIVRKGDTLFSIAQTYDVSMDALVRTNRLRDRDALHVGQRLVLPETARRTTDSPKATPPVPVQDPLRRVPKERGRACSFGPLPAAAVSKEGWTWPADGVVVGTFGQRDGAPYDGIDIGAPDGTPVVASKAGSVAFAGEMAGYGWTVVLSHPGKWVSVYAHNAENCVSEGDQVERGDPIARMGRPATNESPRLHFEIRKDAKAVDPRRFLPEDD
jgi:lipoprotein NlpD